MKKLYHASINVETLFLADAEDSKKKIAFSVLQEEIKNYNDNDVNISEAMYLPACWNDNCVVASREGGIYSVKECIELGFAPLLKQQREREQFYREYLEELKNGQLFLDLSLTAEEIGSE